MVIAEAKTVSGAVSEIAEKVGTEGLIVILSTLGGVTALITIAILIPKVRWFINKILGHWWLKI